MSDENPHAIQQVPLHSEMWVCGVVQLPWTNFRKCRIIYLYDACLQAEGGQFQHLL
jgi:hypothetical protein